MHKLSMGICLSLFCLSVQAGVLDPDCTAEKAAKSAAMKATVGVGGRCSAKEAAADSVGLDDKKDELSDVRDKGHDVVEDADHLGRKAARKAVTN